MPRLLTVLLLLVVIVPAALADQPRWAFEGQLPSIYEVYEPLPPTTYSDEGTVLTQEQISGCMDIDPGDPVVLIRGGEVVGSGTIGEVVAQRDPDVPARRYMYFRAVGLPKGVEIHDPPPGASVLEGADYDLYVLTDKLVEVLAPDPAFTDIPWGTHDFCVRVGRLRFAIIRENWRRTGGHRGWQIVKFEETGNRKIHADYTWQPR